MYNQNIRPNDASRLSSWQPPPGLSGTRGPMFPTFAPSRRYSHQPGTTHATSSSLNVFRPQLSTPERPFIQLQRGEGQAASLSFLRRVWNTVPARSNVPPLVQRPRAASQPGPVFRCSYCSRYCTVPRWKDGRWVCQDLACQDEHADFIRTSQIVAAQ